MITILLFIFASILQAEDVISDRRLSLYTSMQQDVIDKFTKRFGVKYPDIALEVYKNGSVEIGRKLADERAAGGIKADVIWLADPPAFYRLRDGQQLLAYDSPEAKSIPATFKDPNNFFIAGRIITVVMATNTRTSYATPKSWAEFPDYGPSAAMGNPLYSGSTFSAFATLIRVYGWEWLQRAISSRVTQVRGNPEAAMMLITNRAHVAITLDYLVAAFRRKDQPIQVIWPKDGAITVPSPIAIVRATKKEQQAKVFVDYVLSREGQMILRDEDVIPVRSDMNIPGMPAAKEIQFMPVDYPWIAENLGSLTSQFQRLGFKETEKAN